MTLRSRPFFVGRRLMAEPITAAVRLVVTPEPGSRPAIRRDTPVQCPSCGRAASRKARQQRYCSTRCQQRERAKKRSRKALIERDTGAPRNPSKFASKINALQGHKWRPSIGISAPAAVIHGELFAGRKWE